MGTLASELGGHVHHFSGQPRVYVDANVPAGLVGVMRRASDGEHYRLARQLRRTLITLDRDYLDDRRFPPAESGGVLVLTAPTENGLMALLKRFDKELLRTAVTDGQAPAIDELPLEGRKLHIHVDWDGR
jgi:hypothetical protein